jgi:hypothetical protein
MSGVCYGTNEDWCKLDAVMVKMHTVRDYIYSNEIGIGQFFFSKYKQIKCPTNSWTKFPLRYTKRCRSIAT